MHGFESKSSFYVTSFLQLEGHGKPNGSYEMKFQ